MSSMAESGITGAAGAVGGSEDVKSYLEQHKITAVFEVSL